MAKFHGTLEGQGKTHSKRTTLGTEGIKAIAQSWAGSVSVSLSMTDDGDHYAVIRAEAGSTADPRDVTIYHGPLHGLTDQDGPFPL